MPDQEKHCTSRCGCWCENAAEKERCVYWGTEYPNADRYFDAISDVVEANPITGHRKGGAGDPE